MDRPTHRRLLLACLLVLAAACGSRATPSREAPTPPARTQAQSPPECPRAQLDRATRPRWAISGAWAAPDELVLANDQSNNLRRYDGAGRFVGLQPPALPVTLADRFPGNGSPFYPTTIETDGKGLWLGLVGTRFAHLDDHEQLLAAFDLWKLRLRGHPQGGKLTSVSGWTPAGDDQLFGYGTFQLEDGTARDGFFRVTVGPSPRGVLFRTLPIDGPMDVWHRIGWHLEAGTSDGTGYALLVEDTGAVSIARSRPDAGALEELHVLPTPVAAVPRLDDYSSAEEYAALLAHIESLTLPVGLFSWESHLYLLWRRPRKAGDTEWLLSKIDPRKKRLLATAPLPTQAHHLVVVPGPRRWALVEKGEVDEYGLQSVPSIVFVPAAAIRGLQNGVSLCP